MAQVRGLGAIAVRNLRRRPFRTLSLLLSIALLATLVIFSLASLLRLGQGIQLTLRRMGGDIMVAPPGAVTNPEEFLFATDRLSLHIKRDTLARLREMPAVDKVTAHTYLATLAGVCCSISSARIVAFDPETDFVITPWIEQRLKRKLGKDEVVLGGKVEGISSIEMSRETWLLGMKFNVAATLDVTGTPLDNTVFLREADVREAIEKKLTPYVVSPDEVSVAFVALRRGFDPDTVAKTIERENLDVKAITRGEIGSRLTRFFRVTLQIFLLTVAVGSILALLVVASVFSAVANERTREVGILRALGATRGHVIRLFLAEAVATGFIGGLVGIAAGAALSVPAVRAVDEVTRFPVYFSPLVLLAIGAGGPRRGGRRRGARRPAARAAGQPDRPARRDQGHGRGALGAPGRDPRPAPALPADVLVRVRELEKRYPGAEGHVAAMEGLSLEIRRGEFLAILGHSGSGKTTLLSLIGGLTRPTHGEVLLAGEDVARLDEARLAAVRNRSIGFIFQFASLVPTLTALENVLLPAAFSPTPPPGVEEEGRRLLGLVGLADKVDAYPGQLSGGQQRRVAIARAFILDPQLILADEPTGDLDVETEQEVMGLFRELHRRGVTIAMVTHEREITKDADRVVTMDSGRISLYEPAAKLRGWYRHHAAHAARRIEALLTRQQCRKLRLSGALLAGINCLAGTVRRAGWLVIEANRPEGRCRARMVALIPRARGSGGPDGRPGRGRVSGEGEGGLRAGLRRLPRPGAAPVEDVRQGGVGEDGRADARQRGRGQRGGAGAGRRVPVHQEHVRGEVLGLPRHRPAAREEQVRRRLAGDGAADVRQEARAPDRGRGRRHRRVPLDRPTRAEVGKRKRGAGRPRSPSQSPARAPVRVRLVLVPVPVQAAEDRVLGDLLVLVAGVADRLAAADQLLVLDVVELDHAVLDRLVAALPLALLAQREDRVLAVRGREGVVVHAVLAVLLGHEREGLLRRSRRTGRSPTAGCTCRPACSTGGR